MVNTASKLTVVLVDGTSSPPSPMGGSPASGTYSKTAATYYEPGAASVANLLLPGNYEQTMIVLTATSSMTGTSKTVTTTAYSGSDGGLDTRTAREVCASYDVSRGEFLNGYPYPATANSFVLFQSANGNTYVYTFTKQ